MRRIDHGPVAPVVQPFLLIAVEEIDCRESLLRVGGHGGQHVAESGDECLDASCVEEFGVEFNADCQFCPRHGLDGQRVVGVIPGGDVADAEFARGQPEDGIDGVVLIDEDGVEESVMTGEAVNFAQRQMVVFKGAVSRVLQLPEQIRRAGLGRDRRPDGHRVDEQPHHRVRPGHIGGAAGDRHAERDVVLPGQRGQDDRPRSLEDRTHRGVTGAAVTLTSQPASGRGSTSRSRPSRPTRSRVGSTRNSRPAWMPISRFVGYVPASEQRSATWADRHPSGSP